MLRGERKVKIMPNTETLNTAIINSEFTRAGTKVQSFADWALWYLRVGFPPVVSAREVGIGNARMIAANFDRAARIRRSGLRAIRVGF